MFFLTQWLPSQTREGHSLLKSFHSQELFTKMLLEISNNVSTTILKTVVDMQTQKTNETHLQLQAALKPLSAGLGKPT